MEKKINKEIRSCIYSIILTTVFVVVASWFWFGPRVQLTGKKQVFLNNTANLYFYDLSDGIKLDNALPVKDEIGSQVEPYEFKIVNSLDKPVSYTIMFVNNKNKDHDCRILENNYIRYTLSEDGKEYTMPRNLAMDGAMYIDEIEPKGEKVYRLKFWIDYNAGNEIMNTHFHGIVMVSQNNEL